jgi:uncharacterized protein YvpB
VLSWNDDLSVLRFVPTVGWGSDTFYTVNLTGALLEFVGKEHTFSFRTLGAPKVASVFPSNGMVGVATGIKIALTFDKPVKQKSVESRFSLEPTILHKSEPSVPSAPSVPGTFEWNDRTMSFKPLAPLAYSAGYKIILERGVEDLDGRKAQTRVVVPFTTEPQTTLLNIKLDFQDRALSCEAASLKMALSHYGVTVTENDIMDIIGFDPTPKRGNIWGDPDKAYVGNIDGKQNTTGYGVHWGPVAAAGAVWRSAESFSNWTLTQLLSEVEAGHPVIVWGIYPGGRKDSWVTPEGKEVRAWVGEHTRVVVGFTGTKEKPTRIIVLDPYSGKQFWIPDDFISNWAAFDMSGVVVR